MVLTFASWCEAPKSELERLVSTIDLPPGFNISVFRAGLPGARSLALGKNGTVFVGTMGKGQVYAVVDSSRSGIGDVVYTIARGLSSPNGVAFNDGSLYIAEIWRIVRLDNIEARLADPGKPEVVYDRLPRDGWHGWKYIKFGPDGKLYVPVGAPCNVCIPPGPLYASLHRMNADGTGFETYAVGIRNTVGFDWDPRTKVLWFTDNGRDYLGDNLPPDELDYAPAPRLNFGFPYVYGDNVKDPEYGKSAPKQASFQVPAMNLGPHVAALGMTFYAGAAFPKKYRNQIFIAEHGSWNRSVPIGYRITVVTLEGNKAMSYEPFATGWLRNGSSWGRPVDVLVLQDGSLLVSDDKAGAIYRITYSGSRS
jgi:glucose/arabinose dehydrogenase